MMNILFAIEVKSRADYLRVLDEMDVEVDGDFEFAAWRYKNPARVHVAVHGPPVLKKVALGVSGCVTIPVVTARSDLGKGKAKVITHGSAKEALAAMKGWDGSRSEEAQSDESATGLLLSLLKQELGEDRIVG